MNTPEQFLVTILMPCLNESVTLPICISKAKSWASKHPNIRVEILVADNGSNDGSQELAKSCGARVINVAERGYGSALYAGCHQALGEFIIMGDADASYDFEHLDQFLHGLKIGNDLVIGNRFTGVITENAMPWKNRYIGNPILSFIGRSLFPVKVGDFHCGLRAISKSAFLALDLRTTGMEFASEMLIKAGIMGLKIHEIPTNLYPDGRSRPPHLKPWRDGWRHLRFMLLLSPRWLFIYPGLFLAILFLMAYIYLLLGPQKIGSIVFDTHTLFYVQTGLILSVLMLYTGSLLRAFAFREGLLPSRNWLTKIRQYPVFEIGAIFGVTAMCAGIAWALSAFMHWSYLGFGPLEGQNLIRTISMSTTLMMLAGLTFLWSLVMGFISLPLRKYQ